MPDVVVLDTEALSALASPGERGSAALRARAVLRTVTRRDATVRVPAAVLVEAYRGGPRDAAIDRVLARTARVVTTGRRTARIAGALLARDGLDSCHCVDALVVATAVRLGGAVVLTADADDLRALAVGHPNVEVLALP